MKGYHSCVMKGGVIGIPIIFILLAGAIFSFANDDLVEDWLRNNSLVIESEDGETLPIQNNESWLVLIVDFSDSNNQQSSMISAAETMLIPHAQNYINELSHGTVDLEIDIHNVMFTAPNTMAAYGSDTGIKRDSDIDGTHLPMILAEEVIVEFSEAIDWSKYDLNADGSVDRLLILHTAIGQETGGDSNRIWSHFAMFQKPLNLPKGMISSHYAMASLGSESDGFGTAMHEMLHQMGAYDLYPSDGQQTSIWKGVGDWDIMASGNWNNGGKTPALPMSSTKETIGLYHYQNLTFDWQQSTDNCNGPTININPADSFLPSHKIRISNNEYVWIEYRGGNIYDESLPGTGLLVSYQDTTIAGYDDNELNVNNKRPYLKIIEADGNNDLLSGTNQGQATDLFSNGSSFGSQGIEVRNHDGILVDWYAEIIINTEIEITFKTDSCSSQFTVNMPNHAITTLLNEPIVFDAETTMACNLENNLVSTDGRLVSVNPSQLYPDSPTEVEISFNSAAQHNSKTRLIGNLSCNSEARDIDTEILSLSIIPQDGEFSSTIPVTKDITIAVPVDFVGSGSHTFSYTIDGPLSRIASSQQTLSISETNSILAIEIQPRGLLSNNMIVNGEIEIMDSNDNKWVINVTLTAESTVGNSLNDYINPGQLIGLACLFAALWVFLTIKDAKSSSTQVVEEPIISPNMEPTQLDAWGRLIDD